MLDLSVLRSTVPFLRRALPASMVLFCAAACSDPPVDSETPTPRGVIEGSMLYIGPRPKCDYVDGVPVEVSGRVLLTIVDNANPLPPEGTASLPVDFLAVGGEDIFSLEDCMPETEDLTMIIMKTATFRWADLPLAVGEGNTVSYRIAGFYDQEGDFNPLFAVKQTNTRGDMAGAALVNASAPVPQFQLVTFGSVQENPLGAKATGVAITFGGFVQTEPPMFYVTDGDIPSAAFAFDQIALEFSLFPRSAADPARQQIDTLFAAMGMSGFIQFENPLAYAWYNEAFDLNRNGMADEVHPIYRPAPYESPYVFLQRYQNEIETATGVPTVAMIPRVFPDITHASYPTLPLQTVPIAAMITNSASPFCRVSYFAPMNPQAAHDGAAAQQTASECHELPTGYYGANVLSGIAGGSVVVGAGAGQSNTTFDITGGQFSNQVWRVPNELGDCRQLGNSADCLTSTEPLTNPPILSQGLAGAVIVHDADESNPAGAREAGSTCSVNVAPFANDPTGVCCAPVAHLCDVPLCPYEDATPTWGGGTTYRIRGRPSSIVRGRNGARDTPNCMPFPIPQQCCPNPVPTE